jgi:hypothetical protein
MPNPTYSDLHVSTALTDLSVAYANGMRSLYDTMFPVHGVAKQADKYFTFDRRDHWRSDAKDRAPGAEVAIGGYRVSTDNYFCDRKAIGHDISDPERANADPAVANLDGDATEYVTEQIRLRNEIDWVANYFTTAVWDGASSSTDMTGQAAPASTTSNFLQWNDVNSTPIEDLRGEMTAVSEKTGKRPNKLATGSNVWTVLADHPDILDRIKYTERGIVGEDLLASLLGLDEVIVGDMVQDSAVEGAASGSFAFIAGRSALLAYVAPAPGLKRVSAGYTFTWTGMTGAPSIGARIKRYRLERNESDRIEGETWRDFKVVSSNCGAFFATCVST